MLEKLETEKNSVLCSLPLFGSFCYTDSPWDPSDDRSYETDADNLGAIRLTPAAREELSFNQTTDDQTDAEVVVDRFNDTAGTCFRYSEYTTDVVEGYAEWLTDRLQTKYPEKFKGLKIHRGATFKENVAICTLERAEAVIEYDPRTLSEDLDRALDESGARERVLKALVAMGTFVDGYIPYYTNDRWSWDELLKDIVRGVEDEPWAENLNVYPSYALGLALEILAYGEDEFEGEGLRFSDIHPAYYDLSENISPAEYYDYGQDLDEVVRCLQKRCSVRAWRYGETTILAEEDETEDQIRDWIAADETIAHTVPSSVLTLFKSAS